MIFLLTDIVTAKPNNSYFQDHMTVRGYSEFRFTYSDINGTPWQSVQRIRPMVKWHMTDRVNLVLTPEAILTQGRYEKGEFYSLLEGPIEEIFVDKTLDDIDEECDWNLERERQITEVQDVLSTQRLYLDINMRYVDFRLGRQAVNWGSALFFNPTDVLAENLISSPWQERSGVNAIRSTVPISEEGQIISIIATDNEFDSWKLSVKGGGNVATTDIYAVGFVDENRNLIGFDIKGDAIVGYWAEGAYSYDRKDGFDSGNLNLSVGTDYSVPLWEQILFVGQITYDSSGEVDPKYYNWAARQNPELTIPPCDAYESIIPAPPNEYRQTLGRWYGLLAVHAPVHSNITLSTTSLFNLNDGTGLIFPSISAEMGDRWQVHAGGQFLLGENGEFKPQIQNTSGVDFTSLIPSKTVLAWARWSL